MSYILVDEFKYDNIDDFNVIDLEIELNINYFTH